MHDHLSVRQSTSSFDPYPSLQNESESEEQTASTSLDVVEEEYLVQENGLLVRPSPSPMSSSSNERHNPVSKRKKNGVQQTLQQHASNALLTISEAATALCGKGTEEENEDCI